MTNTAKKIAPGLHEYRGWKIKKRAWALPRSVEWYFSKEDEEWESPTLNEAKAEIDIIMSESWEDL